MDFAIEHGLRKIYSEGDVIDSFPNTERAGEFRHQLSGTMIGVRRDDFCTQ